MYKEYFRAVIFSVAIAAVIASSGPGNIATILRTGDATAAGGLILLEAVSLGPAYQTKRTEVTERFVQLIQAYLDEAVRDGAPPPRRNHRARQHRRRRPAGRHGAARPRARAWRRRMRAAPGAGRGRRST